MKKPAPSLSEPSPKRGLGSKRVRPKLTLPIPKIQINGGGESGPSHTHKAQTTVTEMPQLRRRFGGVADHRTDERVRRGSTPPLTNGKETEVHKGSGNSEARRGTVHLFRGISEERRGSLSHTPRAFKLRQLTLNYDRTKMKAPSQANEGTTPSTPMMDPLLDQKAASNAQSPDSYRPRIVSSSWSWSALLARHYYGLSNFKLCVTLFINFLLLTYKVSEYFPLSLFSFLSPLSHSHSDCIHSNEMLAMVMVVIPFSLLRLRH